MRKHNLLIVVSYYKDFDGCSLYAFSTFTNTNAYERQTTVYQHACSLHEALLKHKLIAVKLTTLVDCQPLSDGLHWMKRTPPLHYF